MPTPSDALITPVTFRVPRKRGLRGFLKVWDERETGRREIDCEWVVSKRLWQRLQREWKGLQQQQQQQSQQHSTRRDRAGSKSSRYTTGQSSLSHHAHHQSVPTATKVKERVILFIHGGESFSSFFLHAVFYLCRGIAFHSLELAFTSRFLFFVRSFRLPPLLSSALHCLISPSRLGTQAVCLHSNLLRPFTRRIAFQRHESCYTCQCHTRATLNHACWANGRGFSVISVFSLSTLGLSAFLLLFAYPFCHPWVLLFLCF